MKVRKPELLALTPHRGAPRCGVRARRRWDAELFVEFRDNGAVQLRRSSTFTSASFSLCITEKKPRGNASKISHFDESTRSISSITCANRASASLTAGFIGSAAAGVVTERAAPGFSLHSSF